MNEKSLESEMQQWFSTYGVLTAQRLFNQLNIELNDSDLIAAVNNPRSVYYKLLRVPIKQVYNGIILQQAKDYLVYAQKIFIDYLLSGESDKENTSPGAETREQLETARLQLMEFAEAFNNKITAHQQLIAKSQAQLIKVADELKKRPDVLPPDIDKQLSPFLESADELGVAFRNYRREFYHFIISASELIQLLPDYRPDETKKAEHLSELEFDSLLGEPPQ